jgi:anti-sigma regulatory factor (Ser/Thr protein kinase)
MVAAPPELAGLRSALRTWLKLQRVCGLDAVDTLLAVGEAAANAVEHAYPPTVAGRIDIEVTRFPHELTMRIRDFGHWRSVPAHGDRGRGLLLMRAVSDLEVARGDMGTTVTMRKRTGFRG